MKAVRVDISKMEYSVEDGYYEFKVTFDTGSIYLTETVEILVPTKQLPSDFMEQAVEEAHIQYAKKAFTEPVSYKCDSLGIWRRI